jgi:hypothetical protein
MVSMLALRAIDRGFEPWSNQTKDYKNFIMNKGKTYGTKWNKGDPIRKSSSERYRLILASIIVATFTSIIMSCIYSKWLIVVSER